MLTHSIVIYLRFDQNDTSNLLKFKAAGSAVTISRYIFSSRTVRKKLARVAKRLIPTAPLAWETCQHWIPFMCTLVLYF